MRHPLLTADRTTREIDFIENQLNSAPGARILDVGCGFGRHSIELARRGYIVTGIDPSAALITEARKRAAQAAVTVDFQQEWGERFITGQPIDIAICLFTSLGQISAEGENSALVERVHLALKAGGHFLVEVPQRETAVSNLKMREKFDAGDQVTTISRSYETNNHVITEEFRVVTKGKAKTYLLKVNLFDRVELETTLTRAGFTLLQAYGDYTGTPLTEKHDVMLLLARKGD